MNSMEIKLSYSRTIGRLSDKLEHIYSCLLKDDGNFIGIRVNSRGPVASCLVAGSLADNKIVLYNMVAKNMMIYGQSFVDLYTAAAKITQSGLSKFCYYTEGAIHKRNIKLQGKGIIGQTCNDTSNILIETLPSQMPVDVIESYVKQTAKDITEKIVPARLGKYVGDNLNSQENANMMDSLLRTYAPEYSRTGLNKILIHEENLTDCKLEAARISMQQYEKPHKQKPTETDNV